MKWTKPEFEVVELCSEVTSYLYHRQKHSETQPSPRAGALVVPERRSSGSGLVVRSIAVRDGPRINVQIRVLGSAAGGGFPQWNCHCVTCDAARDGRAVPRTQSSLAVRGTDGPWFLVNASPDARQQLEALQPTDPTGTREPPVAGVLLTDAEIDHTAGLLLLRESSAAIDVFGDPSVERALRDGFPVLDMLERYCGLRWHPLTRGQCSALDGSSLTVEPFATGGDAPLYHPDPDDDLQASGFTFRDRNGPGTVTYVPGLAELDDAVLQRFAASDLVLVDGTFWSDDELPQLGYSERGARAMGHVPLSGDGGALEALARLDGPRTVLVHINNTNPILLEDSAQRAAVIAAGVEIGHDGLEVTL